MSNQWVISWLPIDYWRWSMSNRRPKILWPIDYSSMISVTHWLITHWIPIDYSSTVILRTKETFLAFLHHLFFVCDSFICVRRIFPCIWSFCWRSITNTNDSQLCNLQNWTILTRQPSSVVQQKRQLKDNGFSILKY